MAGIQFFVMDELTGQQTGPYNLQQIQTQILNRKLKKNDLVRRADSAQWGKASVILGKVFDSVEQQKKEQKQQRKADKSARKTQGEQPSAGEKKERQFRSHEPAVGVPVARSVSPPSTPPISVQANSGVDEERSRQPLLGLVDSLIEIKQSREPKRMDEDAADKWYEYSVYVFILGILCAMAFQVFASILRENTDILVAGIIIPVSLLWFLIGIWGIRKTTKLVQTNNVMISTNLPAGLTNLLFRLIGAALIVFGAFIIGLSIFGIAVAASNENAETVDFVMTFWLFFTLAIPTSAGCIFIGYVFWKPGTTLTNLESCGVTKTAEVVSICNEFLASVIIQIKNLYEKAPKILLASMCIMFSVVFSYTGSQIMMKLLVDEASFEDVFGDGLPNGYLAFLTWSSCVPLFFWFYSIVGILFVELALAVLACGRFAIRRLQQ